MFICLECKKEIEEDSQFCKHCGKRIALLVRAELPLPPYHTPHGWWKVTTEGDCEGKSTKNLGVYEGFIDEIAHQLSSLALYGLKFEAIPKPKALDIKGEPRKEVSIQLDIKSATWDLDSKARVLVMRKLLKDRPVRVTESTHYASVKLEFE